MNRVNNNFKNIILNLHKILHYRLAMPAAASPVNIKKIKILVGKSSL